MRIIRCGALLLAVALTVCVDYTGRRAFDPHRHTWVASRVTIAQGARRLRPGL